MTTVISLHNMRIARMLLTTIKGGGGGGGGRGEGGGGRGSFMILQDVMG